MQQTIRVPIRARYSVIDGVPILQEAEYADVDVKIIVDMLLKAFRVSAKEIDDQDEEVNG